jgi:HD-GYP domain-containing protein (c-di-GMP phosphodiesterase class II)
MLERALALSGERLPSVARKAKINMALVALHARRLDDGLAGIDSVMRGGDEVKTIDDAVRSAAAAGIRGRLLSARGAFEEAATVIAQARERTTACNSQTALHALDVAEGVLYVQRGALDRGLSLLHEAVARGHLLQDSLVTDAKLAMIESLMDVGQRVLAQQELRDLAQQMGKRYVERTADVVSLAEAAMRRSGHGEIDLAVAQAVDAELIEEPSGEHAFRVAGLCGELAAAMCRDEAAVCAFKRVGLLHDVGKGGIPAPLMAAGEIELDELNLIRRHAAIGADFLRRLGLKDGSPVLRGVIEAHERVDSRGYPHGLPGEDISDEALAVAVAEAFDVMVHGRRWSAPKTTQEAVQELRRCTGAQFAASWVEALNRVLLVMPADIESRDKALLQSGGADRDPMLRAWSYLRMRLVESAPPASGRNAT